LDDSERQVIPFVKDVIRPGSTVHTDGSAAYRSLKDEGFIHRRSVMLGAETPAHISMPGVHRVAALIHRWLLGTHQGAVQPSKLDHYLDEFVFRFNRRKSLSRGMLFYRLLEQAVVTAPTTYQNVVNKPKSSKMHTVELNG
jgi:transposase-like protein